MGIFSGLIKAKLAKKGFNYVKDKLQKGNTGTKTRTKARK